MTTSQDCSKPNELIPTEWTIAQMQTSQTKGIYTLIIFLPRRTNLHVGKLGRNEFPKGYYTYTDSAMGRGSASLKGRLSRHLRKEKRKHWHIDYLLTVQNLRIAGVVAAGSEKKMECIRNRYLQDTEDFEIPLRGFGASDCEKNCASHLLFFPKIEEAPMLVKQVTKRYHDLSLFTTTFASSHVIICSSPLLHKIC